MEALIDNINGKIRDYPRQISSATDNEGWGILEMITAAAYLRKKSAADIIMTSKSKDGIKLLQATKKEREVNDQTEVGLA